MCAHLFVMWLLKLAIYPYNLGQKLEFLESLFDFLIVIWVQSMVILGRSDEKKKTKEKKI